MRTLVGTALVVLVFLTGCTSFKRGAGMEKPIFNTQTVKDHPPLKTPKKIVLLKPNKTELKTPAGAAPLAG